MKVAISKCLAVGMAVGLSFGAFAEDAYVEANGTQCVAVDCQPTEKTRYEVDFQFTTEAIQKSAVVLGWENSGVRLGMWSNGNGNIECPFGTTDKDWSHGMIAYDTVRHTAIVDRKANVYTMTTSGNVVGTVQKPDHAGTVTGENHRRLSLFGNLNNDYMLKASNLSSLRVFRVKVYDDDVLTHDYVPCKRGTDVGFYDLETKAFFGRICGDALIAGGDVLTVEDDPYVSSPNGLVTVMTGYTVTPDTCLEADFTFDSEVVQQYAFEAGPSGTPVGRVYVTNSKTVKWFWGDTATSVEATGSTDNPADNRPGVRRQLTLDSFKNSASFATYGLSNATFTMPTTRTKDSGSSPLRLFSNSGGNSGFATMKLYGFKIYEKGVLKHDYEPMKRNSIGVLRDRVTGRVLFANKNATAVNDLSFGGKIRELPYIESTGGQQILLDYKPNSKTYLEVGVFDIDGTASRRMFGAAAKDATGIHCWVNTSSNPEINVHGAWSGRLQTGVADDYLHAFVVDVANDTVYNYLGGWGNPNEYSPIDMTTKKGYVHETGDCAVPLAVFNTNPTSADEPGAAFRLTHVTVMEDGEVIHLYEPYIKDGLVGLKDAKTGKFFTGLNGGNDTALLYGGDIAYEGATPDAYVESDGTQFVPTDYKFNEKSRIELDFQCVSPKTGVALAAAWNAGPSWVGFYRNGSGNLEFVTPNAANTGKSHASTGLKADLGRYQAIIDAPAKISQFKNGATLRKETSVAAFSGTASLPFGLFGNSHTAEKGGFTERSAVRIFSLRIKEKEGDVYVLKREYLPYQNGETIGFRDSVTGTIIVNTAADANPLKIGGLGVDKSGSFFKVAPQGGEIKVNGTATLKAYAPGAVRYRWTKSVGESIATDSDVDFQSLHPWGTDRLYLSHVHRGGGKKESPDNTLETFKWCWKNGSALECDCRKTKDGVGVMLHDDNLLRTGWDVPVQFARKSVSQELTWDEIKDLDVGSYIGPQFAHHRIPTIEATFAAMKGHPTYLCFVDEKGAGPDYISQKAIEAGVQDQVYYTGPSHEKALAWQKTMPGGKAMIWIGAWPKNHGRKERVRSDAHFRETIAKMREQNFEGVSTVSLLTYYDPTDPDDPFVPSTPVIKEIVRELHLHGIPVASIPNQGGEEEETYLRLWDLGCDAFSSDYPSVMFKVIKALKKRREAK